MWAVRKRAVIWRCVDGETGVRSASRESAEGREEDSVAWYESGGPSICHVVLCGTKGWAEEMSPRQRILGEQVTKRVVVGWKQTSS